MENKPLEVEMPSCEPMSAELESAQAENTRPKGVIALLRAYAAGETTPFAHISAVLEAMGTQTPEVWISRVSDADILAQTQALTECWQREGEAVLVRLPLFGVPFAVKDNIDVAGMPTTAACPDFAYFPKDTSPVVAKLLAAGAVLLGKTNLDQFATGLVGTRSPYGVVRHPIHPEYLAGGSSSGSAVAVARGWAAFSLGTDTAGSGRIPAGFNRLVGLKPSKGLLSTRGMLPACRSLDCLSIFAHDVADAWCVMKLVAAYDEQDAQSRRLLMQPVKSWPYRIGLPEKLEFFGDAVAKNAFQCTLQSLQPLVKQGWRPLAFTPFLEAAHLLYYGPWVAERRAALGAFFLTNSQAIHPVVRQILDGAADFNAVATFDGQYRLAALRRQIEQLLAKVDFMIVPTAPMHPKIAEVEADPVGLNTQLGYYTNFVNLLDLAALAIPAVERRDGLPSGITLIGPAGSDHMLAEAAARIQALLGGEAQAEQIAVDPLNFDEPVIDIAVVGAHLSGQPLNWQLRDAGARLLKRTYTSPSYRLFALANTHPPKPGLIRAETGAAVSVEVWQMPVRHMGAFLAQVAQPLSIGSVELADGSWVKGFLCESCGLAGAVEITHHGGWLAYLQA